jgi:hypothetical protein
VKSHNQKSSPGGSRNQKSTEANKLLGSGEVEAPSALVLLKLPPSTNLDRSEWEVMYRQFVESGLIAKPEPASN